ncbi:mucin-2-like [Lytechinus pictus]|uniref:mucin-2-like n=1 Tax=Lytechinus pictus TaxID=7653 RepID=UPI0030BA037C
MMGRIPGISFIIFMVSYVIILQLKDSTPKLLRQCEKGDKSITFELSCPTDYNIIVTTGICVRVQDCDHFDASFSSSCNGDKSGSWGFLCSFFNPCIITCTGSTHCSGDQSYVYVEYHCEWAGDGDPPAGVKTTPETTKGLTATTPEPVTKPSGLQEKTSTTPTRIVTMTSPPTTEVLSTEATTLAVPTTYAQRTTGSTTPEITTTSTTAQRPSTQPTVTSESMTSESVNQSQPSMQEKTTITTPITNGTQSPDVLNVTQKSLEEILTACFDNATEGESSAKPFRPLSFSTPSETETDRLTVSFYSPFLQTKPVKVAIEAFQDPKPGCDTSPASSTSTTPSSAGGKASGSSLSLNSVVNVTVYCYNGAPLRLREGEYVDVVFPAKIVCRVVFSGVLWRNEQTKMRGHNLTF